MFCLRIVLLLFLAAGTLADDGFDLFDALGPDPTPAKPKEPKVDPGKPKSDGGLDLLDALGPDPTPAKPKVPEKPKPDGDELDLSDALGPDPEPAKPKDPKVPVKPGTGGKELSDSDLFDIAGDTNNYKPDGGHSGGAGGGGRAQDPGYNPQGGGGDQPQAAGTGQIAGIVSTIGVALLGAASSYFAYQKKKLCFKIQGGQDPEMGKGHRGNQNDNQLFSNLLRTS